MSEEKLLGGKVGIQTTKRVRSGGPKVSLLLWAGLI